MSKPLKRTKALEELSREHHHGLVLSGKIRKGLRLKVAPERIKKYTDWFWENHLQAHFEFEEKYIFSILEKENKLIKKAFREHSRLKRMFTATDKIERNLSLIEEELASHIRFEERVLFQEIQKIASESQLKLIEQAHTQNIFMEWEDQFWIENK